MADDNLDVLLRTTDNTTMSLEQSKNKEDFMFKEGMIIFANMNNAEAVFGEPHELIVTQVGFGRVFVEDLITGEYYEIPEEDALYYYDIVKKDFKGVKQIIHLEDYEELSDKEKTACKKACDICGLHDNCYSIEELYTNGDLTLNKGRDGQEYAWIIWSETKEAAVRVSDGYQLTDAEIEKYLV